MMSSSESDQEKSPRRGTVEIDREFCKGCGLCVEFCPQHALAVDDGFNEKGYHPPKLVHPEACVGCNLCGLYCPDFAIFGHRTAASRHCASNGNAMASEETL